MEEAPNEVFLEWLKGKNSPEEDITEASHSLETKVFQSMKSEYYVVDLMMPDGLHSKILLNKNRFARMQ
jgi:hypothetical protein